MIRLVTRTSWPAVLLAVACLCLPIERVCGDGYDIDAEVVPGSWYANNGKIKVTVKDKNGSGVAGKWVWVPDEGMNSGWCIGPTDSSGEKTAGVTCGWIPSRRCALPGSREASKK